MVHTRKLIESKQKTVTQTAVISKTQVVKRYVNQSGTEKDNRAENGSGTEPIGLTSPRTMLVNQQLA